MENLSFVIWLIFYPVGTSISLYFGDKRQIMSGLEPYDKVTLVITSIINIFIWVYVAKLLYK